MPAEFSATLEIDLSALRHNYQLLKSRFTGESCGAVVKANAYGLGLETVSRTLWQEGARDFFVATLEEAAELRGYLPQAAIAVFSGLLEGQEKDYAALRLTPVLNDPGQLERFNRLRATAPGMRAILHVDTGITRLGFCESEVAALGGAPEGVSHVMSHLACSGDASHPKNAEQLARLRKALQYLPGLKASFCNSSGIFLAPEYHFDLARPGCALYGIAPLAGHNPMRHVATLSAPILQLRTLDCDETVGYGAEYPAPKGCRIALAALGYADGYFRSQSNKGHAYIAGHRVPIAGRVSMDMIALDVSAVPVSAFNAQTRVEFINSMLTVNDIAAQCGTIGYEIFTRIGSRVKRLYI